MVRLPFACAIVIALSIAPPLAPKARADGVGVIATSDRDRGAVATAMADAMAGRAGRVVADAVTEARAAMAAGAVPVEALAGFRRVRQLVDDGWRAYLRVSVDVAAMKLAQARTEAEPLVALPGGAELYADAALRLGIVLDRLGRKPESQAVLALALALDPDRPVTAAEFPPDVVAAIDAVRVAPPVQQKLHVTSEPAGAFVTIDGREAGRTPVDVEVARGQHVVVARATQHRAAVQGVAVDATQVALQLPSDDDAVVLATGATRGIADAQQQQLVDAALRYADLDEVILVAETIRHGGPTLVVQRCGGIPARCSAVVDAGFDRNGLAVAAKAAWDQVRLGDLRYVPTVLAERGGRNIDDGKCKLCRNPWVYVGAAALIGTVIAIVATSGSTPTPVVGINGKDF